MQAGRLQLWWSAPTTGGTVKGYILEEGPSPGSTTITRRLSATRAGVSFPYPAPGSYYFRVRAVNANGVSGPTNEKSLRVNP